MEDNRRRYKVLLVDDDPFIHEILGEFLGGTEFDLVSAKSTQEAIRVLRSNRLDIIISDAMMPGESGYVFIERAKSDPKTAHIPIILWTIMEAPDGSVMDATGKADVLVNKPLYLSDMAAGLETAKQLVESRRPSLPAMESDLVDVVL
jgi:CheY-like chemotaxis protein